VSLNNVRELEYRGVLTWLLTSAWELLAIFEVVGWARLVSKCVFDVIEILVKCKMYILGCL
jgi:hypothetical protein